MQFRSHARIHLYNGRLFTFLQDSNCQITRSWTDFQYDVGGLEVGLVNDVLCYEGILEDVLAESVCVEDWITCIGRGCTRGGGGEGGSAGGAILAAAAGAWFCGGRMEMDEFI